MLYHLLYPLAGRFGPFNVLRYPSFRIIAAGFTALLLGLLLALFTVRYAVNQIIHGSNDRLDHDLDLCVKHRVPIVITSLRAKMLGNKEFVDGANARRFNEIRGFFHDEGRFHSSVETSAVVRIVENGPVRAGVSPSRARLKSSPSKATPLGSAAPANAQKLGNRSTAFITVVSFTSPAGELEAVASAKAAVVMSIFLPGTGQIVAGKIASGLGDTLITRTAQVCLKERYRLILCVRETPLSTVTLEQCARLSGWGAVIMPISPPRIRRISWPSGCSSVILITSTCLEMALGF